MSVNNEYKRYFIILQEDDKGYEISAGKTPTGYVKVEIKNGKCRLTAFIQNVKNADKAEYRFLLIAPAKSIAVDVGKIIVDGSGRGELYYEFESDNVLKSNLDISHFIVAAIECGNTIPLSGYVGKDKMEWKNSYKIVNRVSSNERIDKKTEKIEEVAAPIQKTPIVKPIEKPLEKLVEIPKPIEKPIEIPKPIVKEPEVVEALPPEKPIIEEKVPEIVPEIVEKPIPPQIEQIKHTQILEAEIEAEIEIELEQEKPVCEPYVPFDYTQYYYHEEEEECDKHKKRERDHDHDHHHDHCHDHDHDHDYDDKYEYEYEEEYMVYKDKDNEWYEDDAEEKNDEGEMLSYYDSPMYTKLEKVFRRLREYDPFDERKKEYRWFRLGDSIDILNDAAIPFMGAMMPLGYPFMMEECALMLERKDYIIGIKYDRISKKDDSRYIKYIYFGIPGIFNKRDEAHYRMKGYSYYRPHRTQSYGYWIMAVDIRTGMVKF